MTAVIGDSGTVIRPAVPTVTTRDQLDEVVAAYSGVDEFVLDIETTGDHRIDPRRNRVVWIGLATAGRVDVIPMGHPNGELVEIKRAVLNSGALRLSEGKDLRKSDVSRADGTSRKVFSQPVEQLRPATVFEALRPVLFSERRKIGANVKFDIESLAKYFRGDTPPGPFGDVLVADFLLDDTHHHQMSLAAVCKRRLGFTMPKGVGAKIEDFGYREVAEYLHNDCRFTWLLWRHITAELAEHKLSSILDLEMDLLEVIIAMEQAGTRVDVDQLLQLRDELEDGLADATARAYREAGEKFNVNSVQDKRRLLFDVRGLEPKVLTTKTGEPSTSEEALRHHENDALVKALLDIAELKKLQSTYVLPYLGGEVERTTAGKTKMVHRESLLVEGRVHTSFKQHGARTGRLSSNSPNLQNIPARGEYGARIRGMFVPGPGNRFVVADYSQIEPRIMASLSGDQTMIDAYLEERDLYQAIADRLDVSRHAGKTLLLAIAYGIGPGKIARDLNISASAARDLLDGFDRQFQRLAQYKSSVIRKAQTRRPVPYVTTLFGRRRLLPDLLSRDDADRARARRQAFNSVIQGSAADVMKYALIRAHGLLPDEARLLLTVHDEIVVETPEALVDSTIEALRVAMEDVGIPRITVPLKASIGVGTSWAEAK